MPLVHAPFPFGFHWISCFHKLWCCFSWQFLRVSSQDLAQAGYVSSTCQNNRQHAKGSFRDAKKVASTCQDVVKRCQVYPSFILRESVYIAGCFFGRRAVVLYGYSPPGWGSLHHVVRERPGHGCLPMRGGTVDPKISCVITVPD
jgi:hypothetical protein